MALKLKNASSDWPDCLGGGKNYRVLKHHAVLLSAPNRFGSRRNCMALKQTRHRKSVKEGNCIGLKHDRIACYTKVWFGSIRNCMVLKHILYGKSNQPTLKKSKIVWFLNKQGPIFLHTFLLERHKEIVGALVLTLSRGR